MFCPNCGNEIKPGAKFCNGCGQPVVVKNEEDNNPKVIDVKEQPAKKSVEKKYTGFIVLLVVLGIVFVGLVVAYFTIDSDFFVLGNDTAVSSEDETAERSIEDMLVDNCWTSNYNGYTNVLFRPIENNINFDGIVISGDWINVRPYKITEDGGITVYDEGGYDSSPASYYELIWEIKGIDADENQNNYFQVNEDGVNIQFEEIVLNDIEVSLAFSQWADFDYDIKNVLDVSNSENILVEKAQRDVNFYSFWNVGRYSNDYDMRVSTASIMSDVGICFDEKFSLDVDNRCVYIGDDRYKINDDCSELYCEETDHTIYRITDFAFGKIADTDFPPGEFVE